MTGREYTEVEFSVGKYGEPGVEKKTELGKKGRKDVKKSILHVDVKESILITYIISYAIFVAPSLWNLCMLRLNCCAS